MTDLLNIPKPTVSGELYSIGEAREIELNAPDIKVTGLGCVKRLAGTGTVQLTADGFNTAFDVSLDGASLSVIRLSDAFRAGIVELSLWREARKQMRRIERLMRIVANQRSRPIRKARGARGRKRALMEVLP